MLEKILERRGFRLILFFGISLIITLISADNFFFWDTISQISTPANWYYDNNFRYFFLPDDIATGHPTFVGMYLAFLWKLLGKNLLVSHLGMLPFIYGILYQLDVFLKNSDKGRIIPFLILLMVICDATLLSQMSMITFDIPQIFFFIWSLNSLLYGRHLSLSISFTALVMTSLRGSVCGFGVMAFAILNSLRENHKFSLKPLLPFLPGLLALTLFFTVFFIEKHWIIHNLSSKRWAESSEFASLSEIFRNIGLVAWRLIDYGRLGVWSIFLYLLFKLVKRRALFDKFFSDTFFMAICQFAVIFPVVVIYRNPFGHRYFLPVIILVTISVTYWILKYSKYRNLLYGLAFTVTISGYFWIYPKMIAQGWDATPAHWPYYSARNEMLGYIKSKSIMVGEVGTFFPNKASFRLIDLKDESGMFKDADFEEDEYILFSNVYNLKDAQINDLFSGKNWIIEKEIKNKGVCVILFRRNANITDRLP